MNRVLLIDTNLSSAPIYDYLISKGYEVYVVGGNPSDYLAKKAKNYKNVDYSQIHLIRELIADLHINFIVPGCNDLSYLISAQLNESIGFFGIESLRNTQIINNKEEFREFANEIGLPVPKTFTRESVGNDWPLIVKPVDAFSGRGVTVVHESERNNLDEYINHAKSFSKLEKYIIEEYVEGQLYSHSAFIAQGKITTDFIVEEHGTANPFVVDTSKVDYKFSQEMLTQIRHSIEAMAAKLALVDGLIHTQFIKKGHEYWLIEVTRRCPGDLYSQLIEFSTSFNYVESYVLPFINRISPSTNYQNKKSLVIRHTISQPVDGFFGSIQFNRAVIIEKLFPISLAGDYVKASPFGRIGILFIKENSQESFDDCYSNTLKRTLYQIHH
jgi:predicted ATP-grasp superfamily ATP-dependent carboligase